MVAVLIVLMHGLQVSMATNVPPQTKARQKPTKNKAPNNVNHADTVEELTPPAVIGSGPGAGADHVTTNARRQPKPKPKKKAPKNVNHANTGEEVLTLPNIIGGGPNARTAGIAGADHMTPNARRQPKPKPKKKAPKNFNDANTGEEVIPPPNNIIGSGADAQNGGSASADPSTNNAHKQPKPKQKAAKKKAPKNIDHVDTGDAATGCGSGADAENAGADNGIVTAHPRPKPKKQAAKKDPKSVNQVNTEGAQLPNTVSQMFFRSSPSDS